MPRRPVPSATGLVVALVVTVLTACTTQPEDAPVEAPPPGFDCEAVARASADLDARGAAELQRLGLAADDPQALTVTIVAAGTGAPAYWEAVQSAVTDDAPASVVADVALVRDYWAGLEPQLAAITLADADPATVQAAGAQLSELAEQSPDDSLAPAQERVDDALSATCG